MKGKKSNKESVDYLSHVEHNFRILTFHYYLKEVVTRKLHCEDPVEKLCYTTKFEDIAMHALLRSSQSLE